MKKGQVVGGQAAKKVPRGMLPPTGNGPIEVTRESLNDSTGVEPVADIAVKAAEPVESLPGKDLVPAVVSQALVAELPKEGEPAEIITACERRIHAANTLLEAMQTKVLASYFHYAAPAVRLAWETESWRHIVDPSTGKPFRSWSAWLRSVKVSRQHAYRMVKEDPIRQALKGLDVGKLGVRQIDALSPVLTQYGKKGVRELWVAAMNYGDTGAPALLTLRRQLGLEPDREISEGEEDEKSDGSNLPVLRFQVKPGSFDAEQVRKVARAQPDIALLVARTILEELEPDPATR